MPTPLRTLLVANRGEIAVRILRTCQRLGIRTVLAASEADLDSTAARLADHTIRLGPAPPAASYLDIQAVLRAARTARADAIHPGYGFLSEHPGLARACEQAGITFIGPTADQLAAVGDKLRARQAAEATGLPVVPGGEVRDAAAAHRLAAQTGFPVLVKAVGGGGGRGLHRVDDPAGLADAVDRAISEVQAAFGDACEPNQDRGGDACEPNQDCGGDACEPNQDRGGDPRVFLERYVTAGRHVEVQLLGDGEQVIHLGDRDCSVQRRYQKLIEEAPAPGLAEPLRERIHAAAVAFGARLGYRGAGTVEFLVDNDSFYFLEMNARIQVEHPVTEQVCGVDLVAEQIAVAEGRPLRLTQYDVAVTGHAIECRINAEDPDQDFQPSPGTVTEAWFPAGPGTRVDTHLQAGTQVPPFYDSLLAKLVGHGRDRGEALTRLARALDRCRIEGVTTNLGLHAELLTHPEFEAGEVDTGWLSKGFAYA